MLFGVYKPNDLYFEHYLKYRLHFELTVPYAQLQERKDLNMKRKSNTLKKQKTSMTNKKEEVKGKKEEVLPSTANTFPSSPVSKWSESAGKRRLFLLKLFAW